MAVADFPTMLAPRVSLPRPRRRLMAPLHMLRALWLLPTNVIGHLAGLLVSGGLPRRVGGPAARAWLYAIRPGTGLGWVVAVTLGHAILYRPGTFDGRIGHMILAHELAHTRQHDLLGPLYLPLHVLAQATSALLSVGRPPRHSRVHDNNPLEQTFICLGASAYHALAYGDAVPGAPANCTGDAMLAAFGLG
jgi:hypothetical protein